jgi:hypothetical protein
MGCHCRETSKKGFFGAVEYFLLSFVFQGIAGALLRYALSKVGPEIKTAVLHASDMGMPVYAQLGFVAMSRFAFFEFDRRVDPVIVPPTITLDYACDAEAMLGVPDLALEKIGVNCSLCLKKISSKSSSVACADLCKEKDPFVVCEQCFEGKHLLIESRDFLRLSPHKTQVFLQRKTRNFPLKIVFFYSAICLSLVLFAAAKQNDHVRSKSDDRPVQLKLGSI